MKYNIKGDSPKMDMYKHLGRIALDTLKDQMRFNSLLQNKQSLVLEDGTQIVVSNVFGNEQITIVPVVSKNVITPETKFETIYLPKLGEGFYLRCEDNKYVKYNDFSKLVSSVFDFEDYKYGSFIPESKVIGTYTTQKVVEGWLRYRNCIYSSTPSIMWMWGWGAPRDINDFCVWATWVKEWYKYWCWAVTISSNDPNPELTPFMTDESGMYGNLLNPENLGQLGTLYYENGPYYDWQRVTVPGLPWAGDPYATIPPRPVSPFPSDIFIGRSEYSYERTVYGYIDPVNPVIQIEDYEFHVDWDAYKFEYMNLNQVHYTVTRKGDDWFYIVLNDNQLIQFYRLATKKRYVLFNLSTREEIDLDHTVKRENDIEVYYDKMYYILGDTEMTDEDKEKQERMLNVLNNWRM